MFKSGRKILMECSRGGANAFKWHITCELSDIPKCLCLLLFCLLMQGEHMPVYKQYIILQSYTPHSDSRNVYTLQQPL